MHGLGERQGVREQTHVHPGATKLVPKVSCSNPPLISMLAAADEQAQLPDWQVRGRVQECPHEPACQETVNQHEPALKVTAVGVVAEYARSTGTGTQLTGLAIRAHNAGTACQAHTDMKLANAIMITAVVAVGVEVGAAS